MKKLIASLILVIVFVFYVAFANSRTSSIVADSNPVSTTTPSPVVANTNKFKDGSYTGPVVDVYFGNVQVQAVVSQGKLSNVKILQAPNDRSTSVRIAAHAMPILTTEAISAQSANVNIVSGATETSQGFQKSLAAALAQALN